MANNYTQFSEILEVDDEDAKWLQDRISFLENRPNEDDEPEAAGLHDALCTKYGIYDPDNYGPEFQYDIRNGEVWFYAEESGDPGHVAQLVHDLFRAMPEKHARSCFTITWAFTCSKMAVGEFGGGGAFVTVHDIEFCDPYEFLRKKEKEWASKS